MVPLGEPIQHPMMPKTKLCALTGLTNKHNTIWSVTNNV